MFDKIIENIVLIMVFGVLIVGTYIMMTANNKMNEMYFDDPGYKDTENIALNYEKSLYLNKCPNPLSTECILVA